LRAGLNLPLGSTQMNGMAAMLNWIGAFPDNILSITDAQLYWHVYGKEPRVGRKIGHSTLLAATPQELHDKKRIANYYQGAELHAAHSYLTTI